MTTRGNSVHITSEDSYANKGLVTIMSERIDNIYDSHIADEKLKAGTKYERLAAVAYKIFKEDDVVRSMTCD